MEFTILLPVYGHSPWLDEAVESVVRQKDSNWKLLIADDGSDEKTHHWLRARLNRLQDQRIQWIKRPVNLGLFKNLNQAIEESATDWILLLCSDDKLHPDAINSLKQLKKSWPEAELILSTFDSINADGSLRPPDSSRHHEQLRLDTGLVQPEQMVPELLRLGSLNGNLSGMAFSRMHWVKSGPFREDWRHAADWEWMIRASEEKPILLNRYPIASVRTHSQQLSIRNRKSGHECEEVAAVVSILLQHPTLRNEPKAKKWAGHVMQFQLWNLFKSARQGDLNKWVTGIMAIHQSIGIRQTILSLMKWLPERLRILINKNKSILRIDA